MKGELKRKEDTSSTPKGGKKLSESTGQNGANFKLFQWLHLSFYLEAAQPGCIS